MAWLARLFRRLSGRDAPQFHDFGGAIGKLPVLQSLDFIRLIKDIHLSRLAGAGLQHDKRWVSCFAYLRRVINHLRDGFPDG
jgi:hypothetical protein